MTPKLIDDDTGAELWTARQCAEHAEIKRYTWMAYVSRRQAPGPAGRFYDSPVWDADEVRRWAANPNPRRRGRAQPGQ